IRVRWPWETVQYLRQFAQSLCRNFPRLQSDGHPKWKEVALALPALGKGWAYSPATERHLRTCIQQGTSSFTAPARANCTQQERVLGLCN
ncbi:MAG TPA: C4-dicarboxylate ABC transporter substrate-binding protein, partial [Thauera sp.]|nr:C4-dicarboxylate ABC transporter substrate-binding protein [Thauera sp.]